MGAQKESRQKAIGVITHQLILVGWCFRCVAIRIEKELGVAVDGDIGLDISMGCQKVHDGLDLYFRVGGLALVSLRAGVATSSGHCGKAEATAVSEAKWRGFCDIHDFWYISWSYVEVGCGEVPPPPLA